MGATRPDNAIISHHLIPHVGLIQVLPFPYFATHSTVMFSLQLPTPEIFRTKLRLPESWISLGITESDLQSAYQGMDHTMPTCFEEWG